jgi:hypothetical protein
MVLTVRHSGEAQSGKKKGNRKIAIIQLEFTAKHLMTSSGKETG